jgi:pyruvate/2-oxoglutarate dehydrogenase complex dihydrolipoamide acyltransferase (E2) component
VCAVVVGPGPDVRIRVIDGATAVQFLVNVKQMIEDPETPLIEG